MRTRRSLLRGVTVLALGAALAVSSSLAPTASAAPLDHHGIGEGVMSVANKPKNEKNIPGLGDVPGLGALPGLGSIPGLGEVPGVGSIPTGGGKHDIGDIPVIGDIANTFKDKEPEEIVTGAIQLGAAAAEIVVPLVFEATR